MIIVLADAVTEAELAARLFASSRHRLGDQHPDVAVVAIGGQRLATLAAVVHAAPVTDRQAAAVLDCSTRTVRRLVAAGELERVGRRITVTSLTRLVESRR